MSTRSFIGMYNDDDTITAIYCHFDGYPEGVGRTLLNHWTDPEKVEALMALGNLSVLGEEIGEAHGFDDRTHPTWCKAYGRDRKERGDEAKTYNDRNDFLSAAHASWADFAYLLKQDLAGAYTWRVYDINGQDIRSILGVGVYA